MKNVFSLMLGAVVLVGCASQPEKPLETSINTYATTEQGKPGGVFTATEELNATVDAIDQKARTFVLKDGAGNRRTISAPPEMINFPQLQVGDKVNAIVIVETVVSLEDAASGAANQGKAEMVAAAPEEGQKPGLVAAARVQTSAKVQAVDDAQKTATLQFEDGSTRTVRVRNDVKLSPTQIGKTVRIDITTAVAVEVKKQ